MSRSAPSSGAGAMRWRSCGRNFRTRMSAARARANEARADELRASGVPASGVRANWAKAEMMKTGQAKRVEAIFLEVVELPAELRSAFLTKQCDGDGDLFRRVQRLLDADAANIDTTLGEPKLAEFAQDHVPLQVGAYLRSEERR